VVGISDWLDRFFKNTKVLALSKKEDDANELVGKAKFINSQLPDFLRITLEPNQEGVIGYPSTDGKIKAQPSTEDAGRSTDATMVFCDEWEYHPYAERNFGAVKPTIDGGGLFIGGSTVNKLDFKTFPKKIWYGAKHGDNNFLTKFYGWRSVPHRDEEWLKRAVSALPEWQAEQEYPDNEEDALKTLSTRKFFSQVALDNMMRDCVDRQPLIHDLSEKYGSGLKIYKLPQVGKKYMIFTDPSNGVEDPHAIVVVDQYLEQQAESHEKTTVDECAERHDALVRLFGNAFNGYELNAWSGGMFQKKMEQLETPNQCGFIKTDGTLDKSGKKGWWTGNTLKRTAWQMLEEAVRTFDLKPYSKDTVDEWNDIIIPEGQDACAPPGAHDDLVDAWSRLCMMRKYLPMTGGVKVTSFKYNES